LQSIHNTFTALFDAGDETSALLAKTAPTFFHDLNSVLIEYWILLVSRLTDPARSTGRENLTAQNLLESRN